jgi:hypothetical protein
MKLVENIYITSVELVEKHVCCLRETSRKSLALVSSTQLVEQVLMLLV